jgi:hypothetical protein
MATATITAPSIDQATIRRALDHAGYDQAPATVEELRGCFADYVDSGIWANSDEIDVANVEPAMMARVLLRLR